MPSRMKTLTALALLALSAGVAIAQDMPSVPFKAADYPLEVRKSLSDALLECRAYENGKVEFAPNTVRKIDFNGDGRDDYVVSFEDTKCSSFESIYCGTGGCRTEFLVTLPNDDIRKLFSYVIHKYEVLPGKAKKVRFWIHHGFCEGGPTEECFKDVRITYRAFSSKRS